MATGWKGQYVRYQGFFLNIVRVYNEKASLRAFLEIMLTLSTTTIFALFALKPTALTIISLRNEIKQKKETVTKLDRKIRDLALAADVKAQYLSQIDDLDFAVNTIPKPDVLAKQVLGISAANSVEVASMAVGETIIIGKDPAKSVSTDTKPLPEDSVGMPFFINIKGGYSNLVSFIEDLEEVRVITRVDMVTITSTETENGKIIGVAISGRTPYIGKE